MEVLDALDATGTLLALISTTYQLTTECYGYRRYLNIGPKYLLVLTEGLASFQQTLETLMHVFDAQDERGHALLTLLNGTDGPLHLHPGARPFFEASPIKTK